MSRVGSKVRRSAGARPQGDQFTFTPLEVRPRLEAGEAVSGGRRLLPLVKETDRGILARGAKMLATASALTHGTNVEGGHA